MQGERGVFEQRKKCFLLCLWFDKVMIVKLAYDTVNNDECL